MTICLISREYPPFYGGGIGSYTVRWSRALAAAGRRVVVVTVSGDGREGRDRDGDVTVVRLPFIRGMGQTGDWSGPHPLIANPVTRAAFATFSPVAVFSMQIAEALPRLVEEFGIRVVEAPDTGALAWFALNGQRTGQLWRDGGAPAIVTCVHSPSEWIAKWNEAPLAGRRDLELAGMERDQAAWSDGVVTPSAAMADWAATNWGLERVSIAVEPYPLGELEEVARTSLHGTSGEPTTGHPILFAGRLEPRKGVRTLLEGFARAIDGGADLRLDLAGEDMQGHGAGLLAAMPGSARSRVRALGRVEPAALADLQRRAGVMVVPSPMDNFPNTCMEAMAMGRIVVAARVGGMAEMIRDGEDGILFEPGDAESCGRALLRAAGLSEGHAAEMGRSAAQRMLDLCGNQTVVGRRVAHYEGLAQRPRARRDAGYVVVGAGATRAQVQRLTDAARRAGADFAHGWVRDADGGVRVFGTPTERSLELGGRDIGPLVVEKDAARSLPPGVGAWDAGIRLARAGRAGVVVTDVVVDQAPPRAPVGVRALRRVLRVLGR